MARAAAGSVIRQLETLFEVGSISGLTDRQLLERYAADGRGPAGEAAFAALVARHGPMVLGVCRQLLGDHHHAEDAFQAVFLVLSQKARSIRDPDLLGNWLYGVALRTARCAKQQIARRRRREEGDAMSSPGLGSRIAAEATASPADRQAIDREQAEAIHGAIERLPQIFRSAVVLCYFEGLTLEEAAKRLRCPAGTLRSRLARAQERLRLGLSRRSVASPAAALACVLAPRSASASVLPFLCDSTTRSAIVFAARHAARDALSAPAAALAREVLRTMLLSKIKLTAISLLLVTSVATGAGWAARSLAMKEEPTQNPAAPAAKVAAPASDPTPPPEQTDAPAPGRMFVAGRVLDPDGKPVTNARAMVYASLKRSGRGERMASFSPSALGQAQSDGSGRFRLDAPRVSSSRNDEFGAVAIAPGYGAGWIALDPDADQPAADVTLRPEQVIQGRLFDVQGRPAQGVEVSVEHMGTIVTGDPVMISAETEGPYFLRDQPNGLPAWPRPAITDPDGRFSIRGAGRGIRVGLEINDPRFARLRVDVDTNDAPDSKNVTFAVEPARIIVGRVTYADTGGPAPQSVVEIDSQGEDGGSAWEGEFEADAQGNFRANPRAAHRYLISAFPPERTPYLNVMQKLNWTKGAFEHSVHLTLPRGVSVRGNVTEEGSGKPIAGARIGYISNPDRDQRTGASNTRAVTAADGSFEFGVMPNPGYLTVLAPGEDYVLQVIGQRMARAGQPGGRRTYAHTFRKLDLKPGSASQNIVLTLRPSAAVKGQVFGPDGRPVRDAILISRVVLRPLPTAWLFWMGVYRGAARDGHFAVHGLAEDAEVPVYFLDGKNNHGTTAHLSGKSARDGPVTVQLHPCGAARARLVDPAGKPVARSRDGRGSHMTTIVVTPGPHQYSEDDADKSCLAADQDFLTRIDPIHYPNGLVSDAQGQLTLPALIPGATYRIYDETVAEAQGPRLRKEFTVKSGETLDLGDILIEKPQAAQ